MSENTSNRALLAAKARRVQRYGWRRSLTGAMSADTTGIEVAPQVDLRATMPPVFDQLQLGSCTANATAAAFQLDGILDHGFGRGPGRLSRLWIYRGERELEGTLGEGDVGAEGHDAYTVAAHGIPSERDWPYQDTDVEEAPPPPAVADQTHYVLRKPVREPSQSVADIKACLSNRQPVSFGFVVYPSFESTEVADTGLVPLPARGEQPIAGHEMLIVGYLEQFPHHALVRNSWSYQWGFGQDHVDPQRFGGHCLMPWTYLIDPELTSDLRTIVRPLGA